MFRIVLFFSVLVLILACNQNTSVENDNASIYGSSDLINELNAELTKVVSEDLFTPPVASRIYAYSNLTAAASIMPADSNFWITEVNGFEEWARPCESPNNQLLAMTYAFCHTAKALVYRDAMVDSICEIIVEKYFSVEAKDRQSALECGKRISESILERANRDGYNTTRNKPKYTLIDAAYAWRPTAPLYGEALEPYWYELSPFIMDSTSEFRANLSVPFDSTANSPFYQSAMEVYQTVLEPKDSLIKTAVYWDCNPGPTMVEGHQMQVRKQNTPGGHWLGIHGILSKQAQDDLIRSCNVKAKLTLGIADAFMAAWETKYHYNLLRPETYINRYINPDWQPKLESPLFPEYTSAHSLVSATSAAILTRHYGDVSFSDDTNEFFGLGTREFDGVWQAAKEAAQSRFFGGIHYSFACDDAFEQGKKLGAKANETIEIPE